MNFLEIASDLIPGYEHLTQEEQEKFENSDTGQRFVTVINDELIKICKPKEKPIEKRNDSYLSSAYSYVSSAVSYAQYFLSAEREAKQEDLRDRYNTTKTDLINEIKESIEYKEVVACTIVHCLKKRSPDFLHLTPTQQKNLARADFSKPIQEIIRADQLVENTNDPYEIARIEGESEEIFNTWLKQCNADEKTAPFKERIARKNGKIRANELAKLFPILREQPDFLDTPAVEQFEDLYWEEAQKENPDLKQMEEKFLTAFIFRYLKKASEKYIGYIDLDQYNTAFANDSAKQIIEAANQDGFFSLDARLKEYGYRIEKFLSKKLVTINNKLLQTEKDEDEGLMKSLYYRFRRSKTVSGFEAYKDKWLDAHAFIQYTGMSTQNESSYLVVLDLLNYGRSLDSILETKSIFYGLLKPFIPLYEEYRLIGLAEKSNFRKIVRALIPMLIVVGIVIAVHVIVSPLALAEIPLVLVAIPAIILGLYLASKYVIWKDMTYKSIRDWWYGGAFLIPEFEVNARMKKSFGDEEKASLIRDIYVKELQLCDEKEKRFIEADKQDTLTDEEKKLRESNIEQRLCIQLEWYDIHSNVGSKNNPGVGTDKVPKIVEKRLIKILNREIRQIQQSDAHVNDMEHIGKIIFQIVKELKSNFLISKKQEQNQEDKSTVEPIVEKKKPLSPEKMRFFKPANIENQARAEKIDKILDMVRSGNNGCS